MSSTNRQANDQQATPLPSQHPPTRSEHGVEPSGPKGDNPATAGSGSTRIQSGTPENRLGASILPPPRIPIPPRARPAKNNEGRSFGRVCLSQIHRQTRFS